MRFFHSCSYYLGTNLTFCSPNYANHFQKMPIPLYWNSTQNSVFFFLQIFLRKWLSLSQNHRSRQTSYAFLDRTQRMPLSNSLITNKLSIGTIMTFLFNLVIAVVNLFQCNDALFSVGNSADNHTRNTDIAVFHFFTSFFHEWQTLVSSKTIFYAKRSKFSEEETNEHIFSYCRDQFVPRNVAMFYRKSI